jgi:hypothetical protein
MIDSFAQVRSLGSRALPWILHTASTILPVLSSVCSADADRIAP